MTFQRGGDGGGKEGQGPEQRQRRERRVKAAEATVRIVAVQASEYDPKLGDEREVWRADLRWAPAHLTAGSHGSRHHDWLEFSGETLADVLEQMARSVRGPIGDQILAQIAGETIRSQ